MAIFNLSINKQEMQVDVAPDTPLLWVLRDELNLKGTKFGCGIAMCGACTVHVNDQPTRSCSVPVSVVAGQNITTIEGLSENGEHPVQLAWKEENVPQCGYCQSGQIMSAVALVREKDRPTDRDIEQYMAGNICRCGTYPRIKKAILNAAAKGGVK